MTIAAFWPYLIVGLVVGAVFGWEARIAYARWTMRVKLGLAAAMMAEGRKARGQLPLACCLHLRDILRSLPGHEITCHTCHRRWDVRPDLSLTYIGPAPAPRRVDPIPDCCIDAQPLTLEPGTTYTCPQCGGIWKVRPDRSVFPVGVEVTYGGGLTRLELDTLARGPKRGGGK